MLVVLKMKTKEMSYSLTKKQSQVDEFIRKCLSDKRYSPTLYEITKKFNLGNHSVAQYYVNKLIEKKWIMREKGKQIMLGS